MEVVLLRFSLDPELLCTQAMLGCQSTKAAFEIDPDADHINRMMKMSVTTDDASVLEHAVFTFSVKGISRACSHQLVRHRIASYSQQSQRHVDPTKNRDWYVTPKTIAEKFNEIQRDAIGVRYHSMMKRLAEFYSELVVYGVPEEDARFVLPNACKTNIVITMNCRELRHFFKLRCAKKAQWEIRDMANRMLGLCMKEAPTIFGDIKEAFGKVNE
jgi:thymidylate synthase (FAD)